MPLTKLTLNIAGSESMLSIALWMKFTDHTILWHYSNLLTKTTLGYIEKTLFLIKLTLSSVETHLSLQNKVGLYCLCCHFKPTDQVCSLLDSLPALNPVVETSLTLAFRDSPLALQYIWPTFCLQYNMQMKAIIHPSEYYLKCYVSANHFKAHSYWQWHLPSETGYLSLSSFITPFTFGVAIILILKHAASLCLSGLSPRMALTQADSDFRKANMAIKIEEYFTGSYHEYTIKQFVDFLTATDIGLSHFASTRIIAHEL
ncbi:hypothetical protein EI94DRAFT_1705997 [Lactarius quietus]|nr:hypothetical protein EI94DRAFT_1705997 [Lactarius quietus]